MKISYNWLKQYIKALPPPAKLAEKLTMAGLEVEGIEALDKGIKGVVVAQILSVEKHPNADRLLFCKVKTDKGIHSIVCGARNMKAGDKVALALPGAMLPKGIKIEKTKIRGVESEGMMCSESELGLPPLQGGGGIMILSQDLPIGKDFTETMGLNDYILNINVTPNRPDCLSILGIAREISAITKKMLKAQKTLGKAIEKGKDIKKLV
ncbi:MAG: phenylalanine--tRNA ligase subunit beta, partial [Deltaproteobacteria bacterium]|nr:phenylalanine--tRNA ligase subunit beta [Deltaproteobacteria bacterium]